MNLKDKAFIVGSVDKKEKLCFFANADLFVLPSHNENFGNVYLESLALGTPIIASTGTPWEEVEKYGCGRWVKNSIKDTADAMIDILSKDRELMRTNSINLASKYSWSTVASQFQDLFKSMKN